MDYDFGWRWLLPVALGDRIRLYGYSTEEVEYWREAMPALELGGCDDGPVAALLVNGVRCAPEALPTRSDIGAAQVVSMIVTRAQARHWRRILKASFLQTREYGLLPCAYPRVAVPLCSVRHAVNGLSLHRPGRWAARLGVIVAQVLATIGNFTLLRGRVLLIASQSPDFIPNGAIQAELQDRVRPYPTDYALYLGTPDDNRKTVVLLLGDFPPSTILKVAATAKARAALNNEASALKALAQSPLSASVPRLDGLISSTDALTLYQEYRPRRSLGQWKLNSAIVAFLGRLTLLGRKMVPLTEYLSTLPSYSNARLSTEVDAACRAIYARLQSLGESGIDVLLHRTHGDFAPWNCAWTEKGLFTFDWEESREHDLALGDAFYYAIAPALAIHRNADPVKTLLDCLRLADRVAEASGAGLDSQVYLALWLLGRVGQEDLYGALIVLLERRWR